MMQDTRAALKIRAPRAEVSADTPEHGVNRNSARKLGMAGNVMSSIAGSGPDYRPLQLLVPSVYVIAAMFVITPIMEASLAIGSFRPGVVSWRFGAVGVISSALMTPLLGIFMAVLAANLMGHRWMQRVLVALCSVALVALVIVMGLFVLDVLQFRSEVIPAMRRSFHIASAKALLNQIVAAVVLLSMVISSVRILRATRPDRMIRQPGR
jgi:hypothetical protein